jgi:hypothetical protein
MAPCGTRYAKSCAGAIAEVAADVRPIPGDAEIAEQPRQLLLPLRPLVLAHRRDRDAVLPEDLERDALADLHRQRRVREHLHVGVAVRVDEARADDMAGAVDRLAAGETGAHRGDATVGDRDVRDGAGRAGPVHDRSARQHEVSLHAAILSDGARVRQPCSGDCGTSGRFRTTLVGGFGAPTSGSTI